MSGRFRTAGVVHPTEYDWKKQLDQVKRDVKHVPAMFMELDAGKVLGLGAYIEELEESRDELLSALRLATQFVECVYREHGRDYLPNSGDALETISAVIAKATGGD